MSDELKVIDGGVSAPNAVLKTLDLAGFKSFVHKTHLEFAPGITAIIGPNGSGKTNLVDALRWALGENNARILRAKRNEELIFGGSESRKALGFAEVLMQLDNTSRRLPIAFTEVEVGLQSIEPAAMALTTSFVPDWTWWISASICRVSRLLRSASLRTSSATTAKPTP